MEDLGGSIKMLKALAPQVVTAAASGAYVDRLGFQSAVFGINTGATAGVPTTYTTAWKVEESSESAITSATGWSAITSATGTVAVMNSESYIDVNLKGCKRYVRLVVTMTATGGSSPSVLCSGGVALGEAYLLPQS